MLEINWLRNNSFCYHNLPNVHTCKTTGLKNENLRLHWLDLINRKGLNFPAIACDDKVFGGRPSVIWHGSTRRNTSLWTGYNNLLRGVDDIRHILLRFVHNERWRKRARNFPLMMCAVRKCGSHTGFGKNQFHGTFIDVGFAIASHWCERCLSWVFRWIT